MMNNFYDTFLASTKETPFEEYHSFEQELVNESFIDSPDYYTDIYRETEFGSLVFEKIEARLVQIMDSKVGDRNNDDYRKIIFPDLNYKAQIGTRFKFDNNIWITYSPDNTRDVHSSCYIRRCNNTINTQDEYGNIHQEPCVIDIKPTKSGAQELEYISLPIARQVLEFQNNKWTKNLFINSRVMFHKQVYKISSFMDLNRTETFNPDSIGLIRCYVDNDLVNEYDNEELQVADYKEYNYNIVVKPIIGLIGEEGTLHSEVYLNNKLLPNEQINWVSQNEQIISIDKTTNNYILKSTGQTQLTGVLVNNPNIEVSCQVQCVEQIPNEYKNIISPNVDYLKLNQKQTYEVYETLNGNKTNTIFNIEITGMPKEYYEYSIQGNSFSVKNLMQNDNNLLKVECTNLRNNSKEILEIELGGLF